jgi:4-hydroxy-tetrahydrodipicolinate reductase
MPASLRHSSPRRYVLVDYTSASTVKDNVWTAVRAGVHVVIGSSGLTSSDYEELDRLARDHGVGVVAAGNFSIMAAVLRRAAAMAAQHLGHWELIDYASASKPDVPSGTARELAETLGQVRAPVPAVSLSDLHGPVEARGTEVAGTRDPLGASAQLCRHHVDRLRRIRRAADHAP